MCNFLAELATQNYSYSSVNSFRACLSHYLQPTEAFEVGNHPTVRRLLRGIFNAQPPRKLRPPIWDVEQVLSHMDAWGASSALPLLRISRRTLLLLLLSSAACFGEIADLNYPPLTRDPYQWEFSLGRGLTKTSRHGHHASTIAFQAFPPDERRCPLAALQAYCSLTERYRRQPGPLFLTSRRSFGPASKDTLARWVKITLAEAGIDVSRFTAHSTRSTSTTAARLRGVDLARILAAGHWTRTSTFFNH